MSWQSEAIPLYLARHQADLEHDVRVICQSHFAASQVAADTDLLLVLPSAYAARLAALLPLAVRPLPLKLKPEPILTYWAAARGEDPAYAWLRGEVMAAIGMPSPSGRKPRRR